MMLKINSKALLRALDLPVSIAGKHASLPILNSLLIEAKAGWLSIKATDMDQYATSLCECEGDLPALCVNAATLSQIAATAGETLGLSLIKGRLVCDGASQIKVAVLDAKEFPPEPSGAKAVGVNCADLATAINAVRRFASKEWSEYILGCVHITGTGKMLTAQASTRRELARYAVPAISSKFEILVPGTSAIKLADSLGCDGAVLKLAENHLCVTHDAGSCSCKLVEGKFPDTSLIFDAAKTSVGALARDEWEAVLASVVATGGNKINIPTTLDFKATSCELSVNEPDYAFNHSIAGKFTTNKKRVNAIPILNCFHAFPADSTINLSSTEKGLRLELGNLTIITSQTMK